jgi:hypothetical protein
MVACGSGGGDTGAGSGAGADSAVAATTGGASGTGGSGPGSGGNGAGTGGSTASAGGASGATTTGAGGAAAGTTGAGGSGTGGSGAWEDNFIEDQMWSEADGSPIPWDAPHLTDIQVDDAYVYVCAGSHGLLVLERATLHKVWETAVGGYARCQHIDKEGIEILASTRGDALAPFSGVAVFDVTDPANGHPLGFYTPPAGVSPEGVVILSQGVYAIASHTDGLFIVKRTGNVFSQVATLGGFTNAWDLALDDVNHLLYVADAEAGVAVVDVSTPQSPVLVDQVTLPGSIKDVSLGGGMLFAAAGSEGVHTLNLSTPKSPVLLSTYNTPGSAVATSFSNGRLYVADWNDLRILDLEDPTDPLLIGTESPPATGFPRVLNMTAQGDEVFVAEWNDAYQYHFVPDKQAPDIRLSALDVRYPATPAGSEAAYSLIVHNDGLKPLIISQIAGDPEFVPLVDSLTIAVGAKDFVEVRFKPASNNPTNGDVVFTTDDPDEPTVTVHMAGNTIGLSAGDPIPNWSWVDIQSGQPISTSGLLGNVILLSYFATF